MSTTSRYAPSQSVGRRSAARSDESDLGKARARLGAVRARLGAARARLGAVRARFGAVRARLGRVGGFAAKKNIEEIPFKIMPKVKNNNGGRDFGGDAAKPDVVLHVLRLVLHVLCPSRFIGARC